MKNTAQIIAMGMALVIAGCASDQGPHTPQLDHGGDGVSRAEARVRELDQIQARAWSERNQAALEQLWSPEFVLNAPSNQVLSRADVFREMRTPRLSTPTPLERTTERVTPFGEIMITMGVESSTPKNGPDAGIRRTQRYTNVWRREGDVWRMIARHAHILPHDAANLMR